MWSRANLGTSGEVAGGARSEPSHPRGALGLAGRARARDAPMLRVRARRGPRGLQRDAAAKEGAAPMPCVPLRPAVRRRTGSIGSGAQRMRSVAATAVAGTAVAGARARGGTHADGDQWRVADVSTGPVHPARPAALPVRRRRWEEAHQEMAEHRAVAGGAGHGRCGIHRAGGADSYRQLLMRSIHVMR